MGKTHLAIALGLRAIENGHGVYFVRAYDLMEDLRKARARRNLDVRMPVYLAPMALIVDEFGICPTTGRRPPLSSPWCRLAMKEAELS